MFAHVCVLGKHVTIYGLLSRLLCSGGLDLNLNLLLYNYIYEENHEWSVKLVIKRKQVPKLKILYTLLLNNDYAFKLQKKTTIVKCIVNLKKRSN